STGGGGVLNPRGGLGTATSNACQFSIASGRPGYPGYQVSVLSFSTTLVSVSSSTATRGTAPSRNSSTALAATPGICSAPSFLSILRCTLRDTLVIIRILSASLSWAALNVKLS